MATEALNLQIIFKSLLTEAISGERVKLKLSVNVHNLVTTKIMLLFFFLLLLLLCFCLHGNLKFP